MWENRSRNTTENARLSLETAKPHAGEEWGLITSAFHMDRSLRSFKSAGWTTLVPYPVDYRTEPFFSGVEWNPFEKFVLPNLAIKENVGRLAYWVMGR